MSIDEYLAVDGAGRTGAWATWRHCGSCTSASGTSSTTTSRYITPFHPLLVASFDLVQLSKQQHVDSIYQRRSRLVALCQPLSPVIFSVHHVTLILAITCRLGLRTFLSFTLSRDRALYSIIWRTTPDNQLQCGIRLLIYRPPGGV